MTQYFILLVQFLILVNKIEKASCILGKFNAAYNKPASQSSTYGPEYQSGSQLAVDGSLGTSWGENTCTHTDGAEKIYWEVDLLERFNVSKVIVTNRGDCCSERLKNFTIVGSDRPYINSSQRDWTVCASQEDALGWGEVVPFPCNTPLYSRYIIIIKIDTIDKHALTLCEVQVIAECDNGKYGEDCKSTCSLYCSNPLSCNKETGSCSHCETGYEGDKCDKTCSNGNYGTGCSETCSVNCLSADTCHHISGRCNGGLCKPGYQTERCNKECNPGTFGDSCSKECSSNCKSTSVICDHISGKCDGGFCKSGFNGDLCNETCSVGTYGENCQTNCSINCANNCNGVDGSCSCNDGYTGITCDTKMENIKGSKSPAATIGGAVAAVVLLIIVAVIIVIFFLRRRRNKKPRHDNNESAMYNGGATYDDIQDKDTQLAIPKPVGQVKPTLRKATNNDELDQSKNLYENSAAISLESINVSENNSLNPKEKPAISAKPQKSTSNNNITGEQDKPSGVNDNIYANVERSDTLIDINDLENYVLKKNEDEYPFKHEYEILAKSVHSCDKAENPQLKEKNRYKNIYPYDNNTVSLHKIGEDHLSTYINASYIKDYNDRVSYIAALGATSYTMQDFWRMIWEQNIALIVMVTNLVEDMKIKCEQYWPTDGSVHYGNITVSLENETTFPSYVIRTFKATKDEASKTIVHYQYTAWPDKSIPQYLPSLCKIREVMKTYRKEKKVPILVHCSAGVGRTGTIISLDILLDQMETEKQVDVNKCVATLRDQRANMVQTLIQYTYLHEALCEIIAVGSTALPCSSLNSLFASAQGKKKLMEEFKFLERTKVSVKDNDMELGKFVYKEKNRDMNVIASDNNRLKLTSKPEKYINAVYVEGYRKQLAFIATQVPLDNTVSDFWKMIFEIECTTIIFLEHDKTLEDWFCLDKSSKYVDELSVTTTNIENSDLFTKYSVLVGKAGDTVYANVPEITEEQKDVLKLTIVHIKKWAAHVDDKDVGFVLKCIKETNKDNNTLRTVVCRNGAQHTGLYAAGCLLMDMAITENEVDIYQAVKTIRRNRPQFITSVEQYLFLHQLMKENYEVMKS